MGDRTRGRPDRSGGDDAADGAASARSPEPGEVARADERARPADKAEPEKARTEIAAGDVADDLADFA